MSRRRESSSEATISSKRRAIVRHPRGAKGSKSPRSLTRKSKYRLSTSETLPGDAAPVRSAPFRSRLGSGESLRRDPIPNVEQKLALRDSEFPVGLVRGGEKEYVRIGHHLFERNEARIVDVRVRAEDPPGFQREDVAKLVAQRVARVVALRLE